MPVRHCRVPAVDARGGRQLRHLANAFCPPAYHPGLADILFGHARLTLSQTFAAALMSVRMPRHSEWLFFVTRRRRSSRRCAKGKYQSGTVIPCRHSRTSNRPLPTLGRARSYVSKLLSVPGIEQPTGSFPY